jgi:GNAT superfamily N-acetyltransferase
MDLIACALQRGRTVVEEADPKSGPARVCLQAYYKELAQRVASGFDVARSRDPDAAEMVRPRGTFLLAWSDGLPVGCVGLKGNGGDLAEVKRLWVAPAARGQGLARRLTVTLLASGRLSSLGIALGAAQHAGDQATAAKLAPFADRWSTLAEDRNFPGSVLVSRSRCTLHCERSRRARASLTTPTEEARTHPDTAPCDRARRVARTRSAAGVGPQGANVSLARRNMALLSLIKPSEADWNIEDVGPL